MFIIKSHKTPQKWRNFIAKLPVEYQLKINGKRCIAARLYPSDGLEKLFGPDNVIFDVDDPRDMNQLAFRVKYARWSKTMIFSAEDVMEDYKKDSFYNSWITLWFRDVNFVGYGW